LAGCATITVCRSTESDVLQVITGVACNAGLQEHLA
jgi:hypothetical protein